MRILSLTAQKADSTGSGVFLTELVKGFNKAGHQQAVVCGMAPGDVIQLPEGVAVFPVCYKTPELPFPVCGMSDEMPYESTRYCDMTDEMTEQFFAAFRKAIQEAVDQFRPDVILCHHLYILASIARQLCPDIPIYGQCHGSDLRQIRKNPWKRRFILSQVSKLSGILALHHQQKLQICETYGVSQDLVCVVGTGYNSDVFHAEPSVKATKDPEKLRLIFAGKLSEKKGVISLLRALQLVKAPQRLELALAGGSGNNAEYAEICRLAQAAPCKVTFLGKLNHQELARQLNASDVFILPSFYEGMPLVLMEAMACGLKVICTDLPGIQEWLDQAIPNHGVCFVQPPTMYNEDEALPDTLPAFQQRLALAVDVAEELPVADPQTVRRVSWDWLCEKLCALWGG